MKSLRNFTERYILPASSLVFLFVVWQVISAISGLGDYVLPSPVSVAISLVSDASVWGLQLCSTLVLTLVGFSLSFILALCLGLLLNHFPLFERFLRPLLVFSQTIPALFLYPLFLIAFGFGFLPLLLLVVITCFFPILVTFVQGLASTEPDLIDLFRSMGASRFQIVARVKFPSALPSLFAGMKITLAYALSSCVLGEFMGAQKGLGVYMARSFKSFAPVKVLTAITVVSLLSLAFYQIATLLEKNLFKGYRK